MTPINMTQPSSSQKSLVKYEYPATKNAYKRLSNQFKVFAQEAQADGLRLVCQEKKSYKEYKYAKTHSHIEYACWLAPQSGHIFYYEYLKFGKEPEEQILMFDNLQDMSAWAGHDKEYKRICKQAHEVLVRWRQEGLEQALSESPVRSGPTLKV